MTESEVSIIPAIVSKDMTSDSTTVAASIALRGERMYLHPSSASLGRGQPLGANPQAAIAVFNGCLHVRLGSKALRGHGSATPKADNLNAQVRPHHDLERKGDEESQVERSKPLAGDERRSRIAILIHGIDLLHEQVDQNEAKVCHRHARVAAEDRGVGGV